MDELIDAGGMLDPQHFPGDLFGMPRRDLESGLLVLQEAFYILDFRKVEKGIQPAAGVEKDTEGTDFFTAGGSKVGGIAFEDMREVNPEPIDVAASKRVHVIFSDKRSFALLDPGELDLLVPMEVRVEMRHDVFLDNDRFVTRHRDGKL